MKTLKHNAVAIRSEFKLFNFSYLCDKLHSILKSIFAISLGLIITAPAYAMTEQDQTKLDELRACMRANTPGVTSKHHFELIATDRADSVRRIEANSWIRYGDERRDSVNIKVIGPADLADASYLAVDNGENDAIFTFIPAIDRVRRIDGAANKGSLWGTDFSYEDMRLLKRGFDAEAVEYIGSGELNGRNVERLNLPLKENPGSSYRNVELSVDQQTCVPLQAKFFGRNGVESKRMETDPESLTQTDDKWHAKKLTQYDLKKDSNTVLVLYSTHPDIEIRDRAFDPRLFYGYRD